MTNVGPSPDAADIMGNINEALQGLQLEPEETSEILSFANKEVPHLQTPETSYFILGSYRDPLIRRVRIIENELNKRLGAYAFVMGDLRDINISRLPTFRIQFHLLTAYADYIVAVYEQEAGGEITELGKVSETPYFEKSFVLPRDYAWMTDRNLESRADVLAAAISIYFNGDLNAAEIGDELDDLVAQGQQSGIDIQRDDLVTRIEDREAAESDAVSYSWVHLNEFRLFELHDRCFPWSDSEELRDIAQDLPLRTEAFELGSIGFGFVWKQHRGVSLFY